MSVHPHDTFVTESGVSIRMLHNNILVRIDKPSEKSRSGMILYPSGAMEHANNTGTIVAFGYEYAPKGTEPRPIHGLEVGLKVLFVRFLAEQHTNETVRELLGEDLIRLQPNDIQLVYTPDDEDRIRW